jgi:antitoxin CptB
LHLPAFGVRDAQIAILVGIMADQNSAGEDIAMRRKRLRYRAWHRGIREMDLILGPYADAHIEALSKAELDRLETLMDEQDADLLIWILGQETPPADIDRGMVDRLRAFQQARTAQQ